MRTSFRSCISLMLLGILASAAAAAPSTQPSDLALENAQLRRQIERQQAEIARLQQRMRVLENREAFGLLVPQPQLTPAPRVLIAPRLDHPDSWVAKRFNGMTYYIVPLDLRQTPPTPANTASGR